MKRKHSLNRLARSERENGAGELTRGSSLKSFVPLWTTRSTLQLPKFQIAYSTSQPRFQLPLCSKNKDSTHSSHEESYKWQKTTADPTLATLTRNDSKDHLTTENSSQIYRLENTIRKISQKTVRSYDCELKEYQVLKNGIISLESDIAEQQSKLTQYGFQIQMLGEELDSRASECMEFASEREFYEQVFESYSRSYPAEAPLLKEKISVDTILSAQKNKLQTLFEAVRVREKQFDRWKHQELYALSAKRMQNSCRNQRVACIMAEQKADQRAAEIKFKKIRELLCCFVSSHLLVGTEMNCLAQQEPLDLLLCRLDQLNNFKEFLRHAHRRVKDETYLQFIQDYLRALQSLQELLNNEFTNPNKIRYDSYLEQIRKMNGELHDSQAAIIEFSSKSDQLHEQILQQLSVETLTVIEHVKETCEGTSVVRIKETLSKIKHQHSTRIKAVTKAILFLTTFEAKNEEYSTRMQTETSRIEAEKSELQSKISSTKHSIRLLEIERNRLTRQKQGLEELIGNAVSSWNDLKRLKKQLKELKSQQENRYGSSKSDILFKITSNPAAYSKVSSKPTQRSVANKTESQARFLKNIEIKTNSTFASACRKTMGLVDSNSALATRVLLANK